MKILNVNISIDSLSGGGTAERTYQMSRFLAKKNYTCTVLTLHSNLSEVRHKALEGVNLIELPYLFRRFYIPKGGLKKIKKAVYEADIIHLMNHWTVLNVIVYYYIRRFNRPYVVCPAGALPVFGRSRIIKKLFNYFVGKKIIKNANGCIAIAENEYEQYKAYDVKKSQISLIPNGVVIEDFQESQFISNINLPNKYILVMGRLSYIKGPDLILQAFAKLPKCHDDFYLIFAGPDDGMLASLKIITQQLNLNNRVRFIGCVSGADKSHVYRNTSLLVVPSRQEAMSIVVLEAGVFAKPALITDQCGFSKLQDIEGGYIVPATVEGLEQGLLEILSYPNREQMGTHLKNYIAENYTWDSIGEKILSLYKRIIK
jgi:glycosyltransferase involved in cell wall biosynthesis